MCADMFVSMCVNICINTCVGVYVGRCLTIETAHMSALTAAHKTVRMSKRFDPEQNVRDAINEPASPMPPEANIASSISRTHDYAHISDCIPSQASC